jgi:demethylmenaquinone methyltransferase/2-methoxy-6-polyprenyl-1,4-benzoquinol methylase
VPLQPFHHAYCRLLVPRLGAHVTDARHAFDYLVESVCGFPGHDDIRDLMRDIGFIDIKVRKLSLGIACIHSATKPQTGGQPPVG